MATAVTSGAVALLLQYQPGLHPDQVKAYVMQSANKTVIPQTNIVYDNGQAYVAHNDVFTVGAGYLDIKAAYTLGPEGVTPGGTAMSPIAQIDPVTGNVMLVKDSTALSGS